jgi:HEAT repeat protein
MDARFVEGLLRNALEDPESDVRRAAAETLDRLEHRQDADALLRSFDSDDPNLRIRAAYGLGRCRDRTAWPALRRALADEAVAVRAAAVRALSENPNPRFLEPLLACLDDPEPVVRREAVQALGATRNPRVGPFLALLLEGESEALVVAALGSIARVGGVDPSRILPLVSHAEATVRAAAIRTLAELVLAESEGSSEQDAGPDPEPA